MSEKPYLTVLLRRNRQTRMIEEYSVALSTPAKRVWMPLSLASEIALEKERFIAFTDTGKAGWQSRNPTDAIEYCLVGLYDNDTGAIEEEEDD